MFTSHRRTPGGLCRDKLVPSKKLPANKKAATKKAARKAAKKTPVRPPARQKDGKKTGGQKTKEKTAARSTKTAPKRAAASKPKTTAPMTAKAPPAKQTKAPAGPNRPAIPTAIKRKRSKALNALVELARKHLDIDDLRPGQAEALQAILDGKDTLAVMPTGSGKSMLYQLPSLIMPGLTVVVSPLIALIKDQYDKMAKLGVPIARIDSTLTTKQRREMDALILAEGGKLVLTTPERMADPEFREFLLRGAGGVGVSLFCVDEAHCVSHWGHDFRPSYLVLKRAVRDLGRPQILTTTATAPPHVREDILVQLEMKEDTAIVTTTFDRPNLHYEVIALPGEDDKKKTLVSLLKRLPRPGLVYCATVRAAKQLYEQLSRHGIPVGLYHGRLTKKERTEQQVAFMAERCDLVMLATNAFGLGVDKRDIRYVLHYHVPGSLEQYAQEAGRGGRDGKPTRCVLLFSPDDVAIQEFFLKGTYPTRRQVRSVVKALEAWDDQEMRNALASSGDASDDMKPTLANLALASKVGKQRTRTVVNLLQSEGWVDESEDHLFSLSDPPPDPGELMEKAKQYEARRIADRQRLDALLDYVAAPGCRSQVILEYLGEGDSPVCGRCDNDLRSREAAIAAAREAAGLERRVTADLDEEDTDLEIKPRRVIRHRVIDLDAVERDKAKQRQAATRAAEAAPAKPPGETDAPADELRALVAAQAADEDFEYEYVDEDEDFIDEDGYEYGEVEVIDRTAAAIAEEDGEPEDGEITVLKRKQREKPPKPTKQVAEAPQPKKKRRRRRRRKKKVTMPSVASFSSPVLDGDEAAARSKRNSSKQAPASAGGPLVEYVRGSMRINSTPVASATPNDQPGKGKRRRRRPPGQRSNPPQRQQPQQRPAPAASIAASASPAPPAVANGGAANGAGAGPDGDAPRKKKRRRRRRKGGRNNPNSGASMQQDGPISFFSLAVSSGPGRQSGGGGNGNGAARDGQPKKRRRRRRRRGKNGDSPKAPTPE
jgi:ATP-dependent DNA helicase RecQ